MLNMDFAQTVVIDTNQEEWIGSPMTGVFRKPLAREEAERGHATSIVQYQPKSVFRPHPHPLGEEILVLSGVFSDETGDFKAGSYFRNPPGTSHAPHSGEGCLLLVKLHQFHPSDLNRVSLDAANIWNQKDSSILPLYQYGEERVYLIRMLGENTLTTLALSKAVEVFVISGQANYGEHTLSAGVWFREPSFSPKDWRVDGECFIWLKTGHF
ncbi:cupin domain-containing protein [Marinomonas sp. TW1]|uniref:cupin domain-containing protein n=1 Tax=Marinomonas sp. TW1 TaxID=1561203 RepID=UPI0007AF8745|nr:cupin domain-containing protein [Marinomonas sp. TW1]KZN12312.1 anti-ECFsigma factor ChrR [Marinomonas sp. TW1]